MKRGAKLTKSLFASFSSEKEGALLLCNKQRAADLAERFGVTAATVSNTLARLKKAGLIKTEPYRSIFLTDAGEKMAAAARGRHALVVRFLRSLGVSEETAELDAEGLEHHLSEETLEAMKAFSARTEPQA